MSENQLSDAAALALIATTDSETGVGYWSNGIGSVGANYYADAIRELHQLILASRPAHQLRVFQDSEDGALEVSVKAGKWLNGDTVVTKAEANTETITNSATNYIYYTAAGTLTVNTTGFPDPSTTPHIPLAEVVAAAGAITSITDRRTMAMFAPRTVHPQLTFSGTDDTDGTGTMDIQVADESDAAIAGRWRIRTWIADADMSEPDAQTDYSVTTGEQLRELEANADYEVITPADGLVVMNIDAGGAKTVYCMAEIDGRIYSESLAITA